MGLLHFGSSRCLSAAPLALSFLLLVSCSLLCYRTAPSLFLSSSSFGYGGSFFLLPSCPTLASTLLHCEFVSFISHLYSVETSYPFMPQLSERVCSKTQPLYTTAGSSHLLTYSVSQSHADTKKHTLAHLSFCALWHCSGVL